MKTQEQALSSNTKEGIMDYQETTAEAVKTEKVKMVFRLMMSYQESQNQQLKMINALVKTSRELANEVRQSAMARKFNVHITDVKKLCVAFRAVLMNQITDVNLLKRISVELDHVMKKILPIRAEGDY